MKEIFLQSISHDKLQIEVADSFLLRLRGLMLRSRESLPLGKGMLIAPCSSIHMMFMRFPLDLVYIDKSYRILKTVSYVRPWLGFSACWQKDTWAVIELPKGSIAYYALKEGQVFTRPNQ